MHWKCYDNTFAYISTIFSLGNDEFLGVRNSHVVVLVVAVDCFGVCLFEFKIYFYIYMNLWVCAILLSGAYKGQKGIRSHRFVVKNDFVQS